MTKITQQAFSLILVVFLFSSSQVSGQTTTIPDPYFEHKLIQLGIDSDGLINGQILNSDAAAVTTLFFNQDTIHSLEGIQAFVNLDTLICLRIREWLDDSLIISGYNSLNHIQSRGNDGLKYVDFSNNTTLNSISFRNHDSLQYANFSNNPTLEAIYCSSNTMLDSLDASNDILLTHLSCSNNNLKALDISNNVSLEELFCSYNSLNVLDVSSNILLKWLFCSNNNLNSLSLVSNTNLRRLDCNLNQLTSLDLSANIALSSLNCWYNQLSNIDVSNNILLDTFKCDANQLTELDLSANITLSYLSCVSNQLSDLDLSNNFDLEWLGCYTNQLTRLALPDTTVSIMGCQNNNEFLQICVPNAPPNWTKLNWIKDITAVYVSACFDQAVRGRVAIDFNMNCLVDPLELGLPDQLIKFERDSITVYCNTLDSLGNYRAYLDTGLYTVTVIPSSPYWEACPDSQYIYVDTNYVIQTVNWSLQSVINCPLLKVDIGAPFLRMVGGGSNYTISYCNEGTVAATNAFVTVDLDPFLNYINSSVPLISQSGTLHTFNIGTVAVAECNSFTIQVLVDTSATFEQTHCTEVHIYPDSICVPNVWSGARINVNATCQNDSIIFTIENVGSNMTQPSNYYIVEDNIMMRQGNFNLNGAANTQFVQLAEAGRTYRILAEQENGYPSLLGDRFATAVVEGCHVDSLGGFNIGFVTQYNNNNSSPFIAIDCQENVGSYDPNDKAAQPEGYGAQHYIYDYTALDYRVRFQNTGTDTAFTVIILDTLSPYLDPETLVMGASSHAYTWTLTGQNILKVQFSNILLVDSMTNEPASNGFFKYKIQQRVNNPIGTIINNTAAIYFDFNPPIYTNTTYHTIGEDFVTVNIAVGKIYEEKVAVNVFPNPFRHSTTIQVEGKEYETLNLSVFDVTGRLVTEQQSTFTNRIELQNTDLQAGIYFYRLEGEGNLINTGKLIVQ